MSKWSIHKDFEFCYGHRTYTQKLNGEFSSDLKQACRHFHGHEGKVTVYMEGDSLDVTTGMLTDFRHTEWLRKFINDNIDHQFVMDFSDPLFEQFVLTPYIKLREAAGFFDSVVTKEQVRDNYMVPVYVPNTDHIVGHKLDIPTGEELKSLPEYEAIEGVTVVNFVPTSENLSKWMADMVQAKMSRIGVKVSRVDWWETPKSCSTYLAD